MAAADGGGDAEFGFTREEMLSEPLAGTAKAEGPKRHVFLAWGKAAEWPEKIPEGLPESSLPVLVDREVKAAAKASGHKAKLNFIEASGNVKDGDILCFPDYVRLRVSEASGLKQLQKLLATEPCAGGATMADLEDLGGRFAFICAHAQRDARCGHCGPRLVAALEIEQGAGHCDDLSVFRCNHMGGHKYAGCVIAYSGKGCQPDGDWYGYVTPENVARVASGHAVGGPLWRGRFGLSEKACLDEHAAWRRRRHMDNIKAALPLVVAGGLILVAGFRALRAVRAQRS